MAITWSNGNTVQSKGVGATSNVITGVITASVGDQVIIAVGSLVTTAPGTPTMADSAGNTWVLRGTGFNTVAVLGSLSIFECAAVTSAISTATTFTIASMPSGTAWAWALDVFSGMSFVDIGTFSRTSNTTPVATNTISASGVGGCCIGYATWNDSSSTATADSDTTNGTWSSQVTITTTGGTNTSNTAIARQYKNPVTATGQQSYGPVLSVSAAHCEWALEYAAIPYVSHRFMSFFH